MVEYKAYILPTTLSVNEKDLRLLQPPIFKEKKKKNETYVKLEIVEERSLVIPLCFATFHPIG